MNFRKVILLMMVMLLLAGCNAEVIAEEKIKTIVNSKEEVYEHTDFLLGTVVTLRLFGHGSDDDIAKLFNRMDEIEKRMDINSLESDVTKINNSAGIKPVEVSKDTIEVISSAISYAQKSDGMFDPTVGPLVELWGIGSEDAQVPSDHDRENALDLIDWQLIDLNETDSSVYLMKENMKLDLGAIAKGYAADEVVNMLETSPFTRGIINLGGNVFAYGQKEDGSPWKIGIQNPFSDRGEYIGIVSIKNKTVVTSGIYERYFEQDGTRYHHLLNTQTGYPIENELASVTIISDSSIDADALSTIVFAKGVEGGIRFLEENFSEISAIFVTKDKRVYSTGLDDFNIQWTDENFTIQ